MELDPPPGDAQAQHHVVPDGRETSRRSSSTPSSLLSNKSVDYVYKMVDDYYGQRPTPPESPALHHLLGNYGDQMDTLAYAALMDRSLDSECVSRAMGTAGEDRRRLEELRCVLLAAKQHIVAKERPHRAAVTAERLLCIDQELAQIEAVLNELGSVMDGFAKRHWLGDAAVLTAFVNWQAKVLAHPLLRRAKGHERPAAAPTRLTDSHLHELRMSIRKPNSLDHAISMGPGRDGPVRLGNGRAQPPPGPHR
jgi:hypothetical protein